MDERIAFARDTLLLSYSRIFFAESRGLGLCLLCATLISPSHGLFGLLGGFFSNLFAFAMGMDREGVGKGVYGFNGVLTGLALTYLFAPNLQLLFSLLLASVALTLITIFLNQIFYQYLGLPTLSMPLNLVTWLMLSAALRIGNLERIVEHRSLVNLPTDWLYPLVERFLTGIGAALFQLNPVSGLIIVLGVLYWSRIAFILLGTGFSVALWAHGFLGLEQGDLSSYCLDFNHMFAALAIGGIFTVPCPGSLFMALIASLLSVLILAGSLPLFPAFISPLAFSFNLAVYLILYALGMRRRPSLGLQLVSAPNGAPEQNLNRYREDLRSWKSWGVPIGLPFYGCWKVSQGVNGNITHRGDWGFAYDFQAVGEGGKTHWGAGERCEDYYSYGLPVLAPADGTVQIVKDGVEDNRIGQTNQEENWGNCIIIAHGPEFYSCVAHLQPGSLTVKVGDQVKRGQTIGLCGNSGRSPYPHLHLQFQLTAAIGSATIPFKFANILLQEKEGRRFLSRGTIDEGARVENSHPVTGWEDYFPSRFGEQWHFRYRDDLGEAFETWKVGIDFYGNSFLISSPEETRLYFRLTAGQLSVTQLTGSRRTGLYLFGSRFSEIPLMQSEESIRWTVEEGADYLVPSFVSKLFDPLALLGCSIMQRMSAEARNIENGLGVRVETRLYLKLPFFQLRIRQLPVLECHLGAKTWLDLTDLTGKTRMQQLQAPLAQVAGSLLP